MDYDTTMDRLVGWAQEHPDVRALVLTGSAATGAVHPLSDRDVEVFSSATATLLADESWWRCLGEVLVVERLVNGDGDPTRLVHYVGGKLDLTILPADALRGRRYPRPFQVLLDEDDHGRTAVRHQRHQPPPPAAEVAESLHWFWAAALMCAKAIVRDEPWSAKVRDQDLKAELLRMIEWDHRLRYGDDVDTRFLGQHLAQWTDADVQAELHRCWGRFDADDTRRALLASVELYERLAVRTVGRLRLPAFDHGALRRELHRILALAG